jgi:pilus assembly protein Flp/PilA
MQQFFATLVSFASATQHRIREEKGATAVEYGLLVGLIAVAIIITVTTLGGQLDALFQKVTSKLSGPAGS